MRISIDATAVPLNPTGVGRFVIELAHALSKYQDLSIDLLVRKNDSQDWQIDVPTAAEESSAGVHTHYLAPKKRLLRLGWEQVGLPRLLKSLNTDVHHSPHYTVPLLSKSAIAVTVHDLIFFDYPQWYQTSKVLLLRAALYGAVYKADAVVCDSKYTADRLLKLCSKQDGRAYGLDRLLSGLESKLESRLYVVHLGVDTSRFTPIEPFFGYDDAQLKTLGVKPPYIAFVGMVEPRKDVPTLVKAFGMIQKQFKDLTLVIAGLKGWGSAEEEFRRALNSLSEPDRVKRLGYIPNEAVVSLLRKASAVVYPSLAEGFGLPALEALSCGAPLITTRGSAMEEVGLDAALLVDPGNVQQLSQAIESVVADSSDKPLLSERTKRGLDIAQSHSWDACARGYMEIYRKLS